MRPHGPLSMEFFRQEYWIGLAFPSPGYLPDPRIKLVSLAFPALAGSFFTTVPPGELFTSPWRHKSLRNKAHYLLMKSKVCPFYITRILCPLEIPYFLFFFTTKFTFWGSGAPYNDLESYKQWYGAELGWGVGDRGRSHQLLALAARWLLGMQSCWSLL